MGIKTVSSIIPVCPTVKNVLYPERYFFQRPPQSSLSGDDCRAKAFRGENVRRGICVLELVTAGVRAAAVGGEGEVSVRCPRVGPRLHPPPSPPNSPLSLGQGQGRSLLPPELELPSSHESNTFQILEGSNF